MAGIGYFVGRNCVRRIDVIGVQSRKKSFQGHYSQPLSAEGAIGAPRAA